VGIGGFGGRGGGGGLDAVRRGGGLHLPRDILRPGGGTRSGMGSEGIF